MTISVDLQWSGTRKRPDTGIDPELEPWLGAIEPQHRNDLWWPLSGTDDREGSHGRDEDSGHR